MNARRENLSRTLREVRELGLTGTIFRVRHELGVRAHRFMRSALPEAPPQVRFHEPPRLDWFVGASPFRDPIALRDALIDRVPEARRRWLLEVARRAGDGRIRAFSRWEADYGRPIDWHLDPTTGRRWPREEPWSGVLRHEAAVGDVKMAWEVARFPQAYHLARAAALHPEHAHELGAIFADQVRSFVANNPFGLGIHWNSGQEIAIRLFAWTFGIATFRRLGVALEPLSEVLLGHVYRSVFHVEREIDYARHAVYNNHIVAEATALQLGASLLRCAEAPRWEQVALRQLEIECGRQFYADGGYIQNAHNYHRAVLVYFLWAAGLRRAQGQPLPSEWQRVMEHSLDFLWAHQNPTDGALPNFGANDGSLPSPLSTCEFADFRPVLQALSVVTRGERLYEPGPWDETLAWYCGPEALDAPLRKRPRVTVSFADSGYNVLRGSDEGTFAAFRCGPIRDRFAQIDMLHLDVHRRGRNLLVDGGSYSYNGPQDWYRHFFRTESHNTLKVDGEDQMLHWRRFKCLYWTPARMLDLIDADDHVGCSGEHLGYTRLADPVVHRRSVLMWRRGLWVVLDELRAQSSHRARLQWLCADLPYRYVDGVLNLEAPEGTFGIAVFDRDGRPLVGDVVRGQDSPPRGWISRHYGERLPTPSLAVEREGSGLSFLTVLGPGTPTLERTDRGYRVGDSEGDVSFTVVDGILRALP